MIITELSDYIQWLILDELEDPGFNVEWRRLMCTCKYYYNLIQNTSHLSKKICPRVPKCVDINYNDVIGIYFHGGYITSGDLVWPLNKDRRTWGSLYNFVSDTELLKNVYNLSRSWYIDRILSTYKYSDDLTIKVPDHYYLLKLHTAIFNDGMWTFNLVCSRSDKVKYRAMLQNVDFYDPISILNETSIDERWKFLNEIAEIIESK